MSDEQEIMTADEYQHVQDDLRPPEINHLLEQRRITGRIDLPINLDQPVDSDFDYHDEEKKL